VLLGAGFSARAGATYQPYSLRSLFPTSLLEPRVGQDVVIDEDFPTSTEHFVSYSGGLGFTRRMSRRQTVSATYDYRGRASSGFDDRFDAHTVGAGLTRVLGRGVGLRLGYAYSEVHYGRRDGGFADHHFDVGVDYNRALSFSRRTTLSFTTGTTATRSAQHSALRFYATGAARLNHEIGRTWIAALAYSRGLQYVETWPEPMFADSATAMVGGLINRRSQVQVAARAMRGSGYSGSAGDMTSYGGSALLSIAVTRYISAGLTYGYYQHGLAPSVALAPGFPHDFDGHTIRASVNLWAPLFQRARRP
jgi:opacity protein-like surface antigen